MKISVIIPYREGISYLRDCLESLAQNSFQDFETILILDEVKKETQENTAQETADAKELSALLLQYRNDLRMKVLSTAGDAGVAAARNLGVSAAEGEYVYFLDSDDYLLEDTLSILAAEVKEAQVIYGKRRVTWQKRAKFLEEYSKELENLANEDADSDTEDEYFEEDKEDSEKKDDDEDREEYKEDEVRDAKESVREEARRRQERMPEHRRQEEGASQTVDTIEEERRELLEKKQLFAYQTLFRKRKGISNVSVLHLLIRRDFLEKEGICFDETLTYYSDTPYLLKVLTKATEFSFRSRSVYVKRSHNDPIQLPALSQKRGERFPEYLRVYELSAKITEGNEELQDALWQKFTNYYARYFAKKVMQGPEDPWATVRFGQMRAAMLSIPRTYIQHLRGYKRKVIQVLLNGNVAKTKRVVMRHRILLKIQKSLKDRRVLYKYLYLRFFRKTKLLKNYVLFESFFGKYYSDSPRSIYEYMQKTFGDRYRYVFVLNGKKVKPEGKCIVVKYNSLRYYYYMGRCKYMIFNVRPPKWFVKRKKNIFVETWHGTPLKRLVFDQEEVTAAAPLYKQEFYHQVKIWDYLISPNAFSTETFRRCFMYKKRMLETGYPRNDILHADNLSERREQMREKLSLPSGRKVILYAPTWRDDEYYENGKYKFTLELNLYQMQVALGDEYIILLRTHYYIADSIDISGLEGFAYNFSKYEDISHLYLVSDILITDYSSVFFDFAGLRKPMIFFTYDLEKYRDMLRGFYLDIEKEVPGPLAFTTEEVIDDIVNIDEISLHYQEKYDTFYDKYCAWEDGHAAEKVVKEVFAEGFIDE